MSLCFPVENAAVGTRGPASVATDAVGDVNISTPIVAVQQQQQQQQQQQPQQQKRVQLDTGRDVVGLRSDGVATPRFAPNGM